MNRNRLVTRLARLTLGESMTASITDQRGRISLTRFVKSNARKHRLRKAFRTATLSLHEIADTCVPQVACASTPLALISQIQRSGGSLLSQLFDGHPQLHAHPHELKTGYPKKYNWPKIDLSDTPQQWFDMLFEDDAIEASRHGYKKGQRYATRFPFLFLPALQRAIFVAQLESAHSVTPRTVLDAYMTSYFFAWLNNQNTAGSKRFITAFTPRLAMCPDNVQSFFDVYPDGRIISVIRDPGNWFASALRHENKQRKYDDLEQAASQWNASTRAILRNKHRYGDRVCIIRFDNLIGHTETVMRYLSGFLEIAFDRILLTPTFNKSPITANTSFRLEKPGIMTSTLSRHRTLDSQQHALIERLTGDTYQQALRAAEPLD